MPRDREGWVTWHGSRGNVVETSVPCHVICTTQRTTLCHVARVTLRGTFPVTTCQLKQGGRYVPCQAVTLPRDLCHVLCPPVQATLPRDLC